MAKARAGPTVASFSTPRLHARGRARARARLEIGLGQRLVG